MKYLSCCFTLVLFTFALQAQVKYKTILPIEYADCITYSNGKIIAKNKKDDNKNCDVYDVTLNKFILKNSEVVDFDNNAITYIDLNNEICYLRGNNQVVSTKFKNGSLRISMQPDDYVAIINTENSNINFFDTLGYEIPLPTNYDTLKYNLAYYLGYQMWAITLEKEDKRFILNSSNCGILGQNGVIIEPTANQIISPFINGLASLILPNGQLSFLKKDGRFLNDPKLQNITKSDFQNSTFNVTTYLKDQKMGLIFNGGAYITDAVFDNGLHIKNLDKHYITINEKYGVLNKDGKEILPYKFKSLVETLEAETNMYPKSINNLYGFANKEGKIVIKPQFKNVYPFVNNYCIVTNTKNKIGVINKKGETIVPFIYDILYYGNIPNIIVATINNKLGVLQIIK